MALESIDGVAGQHAQGQQLALAQLQRQALGSRCANNEADTRHVPDDPGYGTSFTALGRQLYLDGIADLELENLIRHV